MLKMTDLAIISIKQVWKGLVRFSSFWRAVTQTRPILSLKTRTSNPVSSASGAVLCRMAELALVFSVWNERRGGSKAALLSASLPNQSQMCPAGPLQILPPFFPLSHSLTRLPSLLVSLALSLCLPSVGLLSVLQTSGGKDLVWTGARHNWQDTTDKNH